MGLRQTLNENPVVTTVLTIVIMAGALGFIGWQAFFRFSGSSRPKPPTSAYYSDDDGATWYVDDVKNIPPYDHNGKQAWRAVLFRSDDGKVFVARLEGYDEAAKAQIAEEIQKGRSPVAAEWKLSAHGMMVKRPKQEKWVQAKEGDPQSLKEWGEVMIASSPDGSKRIRPVSVEENVKP